MTIPPIPDGAFSDVLRLSQTHPEKRLYVYSRAYLHQDGPPDLIGLVKGYWNGEYQGLMLFPVEDAETAKGSISLLRHVTGVYYELIACHPEMLHDA